MAPIAGLFGSLGTTMEVGTAEEGLSPVLKLLEGLEGEVAQRRDGEAKSMEDRISREVEDQKARARG